MIRNSSVCVGDSVSLQCVDRFKVSIGPELTVLHTTGQWPW